MKDVLLLHWLELLLSIQIIKHETDRQRDRQTDRQKNRQTDRQAGRQRQRQRQRQTKISAKEDHFIPLFKVPSVETAKSVESKEANHLVDKTFSFVNTGSVICFPMPIGTKFDLEVAKISVSADNDLFVF